MRLLGPLLLLIGLCLPVPGYFIGTAEARIYCPLPEHGSWENKAAKPKQLSRLEIETRCENEQVFVRMRAFTKCIPRDCKWGWTEGEMRESGNGLRALLRGFYLSKYIEVIASEDRLTAYVTDIFHDPASKGETKTFSMSRD